MAKKLKKCTSKKSKEYVKRLTNDATKAEKLFLTILKECGIEFEFQYAVNAPGSFYILDFYLPKEKLCFEVDGGYHSREEQILKDEKRDSYLRRKGVKVVRFTNEEVYKLTAADLLLKGLFKPTGCQNKINKLPHEESWVKPTKKKKNLRFFRAKRKQDKVAPTFSKTDESLKIEELRQKRQLDSILLNNIRRV